MRRTLEEELRKSLEITEDALRNANRKVKSLVLTNQALAASDRAHMAKIEQLKAVIREAKYFIEDDFPNGVDGPSIATKRYRDYYRSILAALGKSEANHPRQEGSREA
jgi:chromosome segregation ATPase